MLIGRRAETRAVHDLLEGARGVAAIVGAAGMGKTSILRAVVEPDAVWVRGMATLRDRPAAPLAAAMRGVTGDLELDASTVVRQLDGRRLVVDDAQWLDSHSRAVVELVATTTRPAATWRTGDPAAPGLPPGHWACLTLEPLRPSDARALACRIAPDLTEPELQALLEVADGSPLLIRELAAGASPPATLVSALLARFRDLPPEVRQASVVIAAADAGLAEEHVPAGVVAPLRRSGLAVLVDGRWWPRHALLQESVLELAGPSQVREAHEVLFDLLSETDPAAAARHALRADCGERARALAEVNLSQATDPIERARATIVLADILEPLDPEGAWHRRVDATSILRDAGFFGDVLAALEGRTFVTSDPEREALAHCNLAAAWWEHGDHRDAHAHAVRALGLVEGSDSEAELLVRAGLAMYSTRVRFDGEGALANAREAVRIAGVRRQHVAFARTRLAAALLVSGDPGWRTESDGAVDGAVTEGDEQGERLARESRYLHAFVTGDLDTARADLAAVTDEGVLRRRPPKGRHLAFQLLLDLMSLGDRPAIVARASRLLADRPVFAQRFVAVAAGAVAAVDAGRPDLAQDLIATVAPDDPEEQLALGWARAELRWATGRTEPTAADPLPLDLTIHPAAAMAAAVTTWAAFEAESPLPEPPVVGLPGFTPAVAESEAVRRLADGETSTVVVAFDDAASAWWHGSDRRGALRCEWGAALATDRAGGREAGDRLQRCWRQAVALGSAPVAARAARALRSRGVRTTPFPAPACPPLSSPETQVLRLLAAGFTADESARVLGVSTGTVGDHLHSAIARLDLRHRADAVRWIASHP